MTVPKLRLTLAIVRGQVSGIRAFVYSQKLPVDTRAHKRNKSRANSIDKVGLGRFTELPTLHIRPIDEVWNRVSSKVPPRDVIAVPFAQESVLIDHPCRLSSPLLPAIFFPSA